MNRLRKLSRWGLQPLAIAVVACGSAQQSAPPVPPPPGPGPDTLKPLVCDGQWHGQQKGDFVDECRCRSLGPGQKSLNGWGQAEVVGRINAASPAVVALDEGLYHALGLSPPRCGESKLSWNFVATEPARADQCRRVQGAILPLDSENVSVGGELEIEFDPRRRERVSGRAEVRGQRLPAFLGAQSEPGGEPPLSFGSERQGRLVFLLNIEHGRLEALANVPSGGPTTAALFKSKVLATGAFQEIFGRSWAAWLERMTVVSESCVVHHGQRPPSIPAPGAPPSVGGSEITEPVAIGAKVLSAKLLELTDRPCDRSGARVELELVGFPGLAPTKMVGSASMADDRRRIMWPTEPRPTEPGPAALVHLGGGGKDRIEVPAPKWLVDRVPCAARQNGFFEAELAAVPGKDGPRTSIAASWGTPCSPAVLRCRYETRSVASP